MSQKSKIIRNNCGHNISTVYKSFISDDTHESKTVSQGVLAARMNGKILSSLSNKLGCGIGSVDDIIRTLEDIHYPYMKYS